MKTCPSCGADVPVAASRCKSCFHDFDEAPPASNGGPIYILGALAVVAVLAALMFSSLAKQPIDSKTLVDDETDSIVWTSQYQDGTVQSERLFFSEVAHVEYVIQRSGDFQVVAVARDGERHLVDSHPTRPLKLEAEKYAKVMEKELRIVDETVGFGKAN